MGIFINTPEEKAKSRAARVRSFLLGMTAGISRGEQIKLKKDAKNKAQEAKEPDTLD